MTLINENDLLLIKKSQENSTKVNIISLCNNFGIKVYDANMESNMSGAILKENDEYKIYINRYESQNRQRFTIAHELAHFLLHKEKIGDNLTDRKGTNGMMYRSNLSDIYERQANILASEILMPITLIRKYIDNGVNTYSELSRKLEVSEEALRIRLDNLHNVFLDI